MSFLCFSEHIWQVQKNVLIQDTEKLKWLLASFQIACKDKKKSLPVGWKKSFSSFWNKNSVVVLGLNKYFLQPHR